ncbi:MAG: mechanosensitive ion channel [Bacteroidales bacterium]
MENLTSIFQTIADLVVVYGLRLLYAVVILIVGFWIIRMIMRAVTKTMTSRGVEETLRKFVASILSMLLKVLLIISVVSMLGVEMTSFVAILAGAGLAVGMALSGTLQNFAGGVMIILFKPFKAGDVIEAMGYTGKVESVQIFNTILKTPDNKTIIIPNGPLSTSSLTNYSTEARRRVDFTVGIGYDDDIDKARKVMEGLIAADNRILKDPAPFIGVVELADSSVNFAVRVWVEAADYWDVFFDMNENIKKAFDKEGVSIPYPQTDVHLYNQK